VRRDDDHSEFGGQLVGASLLHEVLIRTRQAAQPVQDGKLGALLGLRWQVHGKHHVAVQAAGAVAVTFMPATKTLVAGNVFKGHGYASRRVENREAFSTTPRWIIRLATALSTLRIRNG